MLYRRHLLQAAFGASALNPWNVQAAPPVSGPPLRLLQVMDSSSDQQEHVRDYAAGVQLAMQAVNKTGGIFGREVQVQTLVSDGSDVSLRGLVQRLRSDPALLGLVGTVGERLSLAVIDALSPADATVPHIAPWLPDARHDALPQVVNLFASRDDQIRHTLALLDGMGLRQLGVVYDGPPTRDTVQRSLDNTLDQLALSPRRWTATSTGGVELLVRQLPSDTPPVLAFAGGSIELARFVRALAARPLNRYVVSLSDADFGLLHQLGATTAVPLVLTQVVHNPGNRMAPYVRRFRELHALLYDDTPTPSNLAGYIAGRYALHLLDRVGWSVSRGTLLDEVRRRPDLDIDGYALRFGRGRSRGSSFVTQTMVTREGRTIG